MSDKILKYSALTPNNLNEIYGKLNPENNNLYPSIVLGWSNVHSKAFVVLGGQWALGHLYPRGWDDFWSLSSKAPLDAKELDHIITVVQNHDPGAKAIQNVTPVTLSTVGSNFAHKIAPQGADSSNYIYSTSEISSCQGSKFSDIRRYVKLFQKHKPVEATLNFEELLGYRQDITSFHTAWHNSGTTSGAKMTDYESPALQTFWADNIINRPSIVSIAIKINGQLVGISINEFLTDGFALNHYFKASSAHKGAGVYLFHRTAAMLAQHKIAYLNYQEDLGIPGLRAFKSRMRPTKIASQLQILFAS